MRRKSEAEGTERPVMIMANARMLAMAIIMQAAADYAKEVKKRKAEGEKEPGKKEHTLIHFFRSRRYERLTALDGEVLMKMIMDDPDTVLHRHHYNGSILNQELRDEMKRKRAFDAEKPDAAGRGLSR